MVIFKSRGRSNAKTTASTATLKGHCAVVRDAASVLLMLAEASGPQVPRKDIHRDIFDVYPLIQKALLFLLQFVQLLLQFCSVAGAQGCTEVKLTLDVVPESLNLPTRCGNLR